MSYGNKFLRLQAIMSKSRFPLELPFLRLRKVEGLPTMIAAFTTDIPKLTKWGEPLLIGPGSIHVAHTEGEYIEKKQLHDAIDLYCRIAKQLMRFLRDVILSGGTDWPNRIALTAGLRSYRSALESRSSPASSGARRLNFEVSERCRDRSCDVLFLAFGLRL